MAELLSLRGAATGATSKAAKSKRAASPRAPPTHKPENGEAEAEAEAEAEPSPASLVVSGEACAPAAAATLTAAALTFAAFPRRLRRPQQERSRKLVKRLCFGAQPIRVVLTRHVWLQLTMMDVARRRKALALFHTLASGAGEATSSPCPGSEAVPLRVSASLGKGGEAVFAVVWERSSEGRPFFEAARGAEAIRVWSIETSDVSLHEVALYVEEAWAYGERGRRDTEGRFPMGTTNELSHPSDKWHPVHAEDGGELAVPHACQCRRAARRRCPDIRRCALRYPTSSSGTP